MAEKIRHQPLGQPLASFAQLSPPTPPLGQSGHHQGNHNQGQGQSHSSEKPNVALHARPPARLTSRTTQNQGEACAVVPVGFDTEIHQHL